MADLPEDIPQTNSLEMDVCENENSIEIKSSLDQSSTQVDTETSESNDAPNEENNMSNDSQDKMELAEKEGNKRQVEDHTSEDEPQAKKKVNESDKFWQSVKNDPSDFQAWTSLLQHVEQLGDLELGREAYDSFFSHYPYCYGYWKKYADLEKRKGDEDSTMKVFHQGLEAIKLSVDLWIHYMEYLLSKYGDNEEFIRQQFERSVDSCGLDFRSDRLWDMFINWESESKRWNKVTEIYDRVVSLSLSKYLLHWEKFQDHIKKHTSKEILSEAEYTTLRKTVLRSLNRPDSELPDEAPPGDESLASNDSETNSADDAEEEKLMKEHILNARKEIHESCAADTRSRIPLEDTIKRPYFHVKPLEKGQLGAWRNYVDFEIKKGDPKRIVALFERCLIATALYEEFWMKYIRYLDEQSVPDDELRRQYVKACTIHLKAKLRPHFAWASFEEKTGNADTAVSILRDVLLKNEKCLEAIQMLASIERRRGGIAAADQIYLDALAKFDAASDKQIYGNIVLKYARFLTFFKNETDRAMEIISEAFQKDETNYNLLIALADHALACRPPQIDAAANAFKKGAEIALSPHTRLLFAHRYLNFIMDCGLQCDSINDALHLVRKTQKDVQSLQSEHSDVNSKSDNATTEVNKAKPRNMVQPAPTSSADKPSMTPGGVNGALLPQPKLPHPNYPNFSPNPQYNSSYNSYSPNYSNNQYANWNYGSQSVPAPYNNSQYNQQTWPAYPNYYGQR